MQFRPKNAEEMRKLAMEIKETAQNTSLHLNDPKFNEETGEMDEAGKREIIEIINEAGNLDNFKIATIHLGWKNAESVIDEEGKWKNTDLANKAASELADLFLAGIKADKTMAIENTGHVDETREILGTKPEHLMASREKIAEVISKKENISIEEVLSKIGFTFDAGHAVKNARNLQENSIENWFQKLGENIKLLHIHDVLSKDGLPDRDLPEGDKNSYQPEHKALGRGIIDWKEFFELKKRYCPDVPMILELNNDGDGRKTAQSIEYLEKLYSEK